MEGIILGELLSDSGILTTALGGGGTPQVEEVKDVTVETDYTTLMILAFLILAVLFGGIYAISKI